MTIPIFVADAFTDRPFAGNPAAVCFPPTDVSDAWLHQVAAEMNLSETAFLWPEGDAWRLRWMTPAVEVDLCGHATLASAHILWETGRADGDIAFETRSGRLTAKRVDGAVELDFPATPATETAPPDGLLAALGVDAVRVSKTKWDYLVELADEAAVRAARPDFRALRSLDVRGVMITARGDGASSSERPARAGEIQSGEPDFVSRFFAPGSGIDEDPVTGSAHCALGPYWAPRVGRQRLVAVQASPRGGRLEVALDGDRVRLRGRAVTVLRGALSAAPE